MNEEKGTIVTDLELKAMNGVAKLLDKLPQKTLIRVLNWIQERYAEEEK